MTDGSLSTQPHEPAPLPRKGRARKTALLHLTARILELQLTHDGWDDDDIAEAVGRPVSLVKKLLAEHDAAIHALIAQGLDERRIREDRRIGIVFAKASEAYERSRAPQETKTGKRRTVPQPGGIIGPDGKAKLATIEEVLAKTQTGPGDASHLRVMLDCIAQWRSLWGLDREEKGVTVNVAVLNAITADQALKIPAVERALDTIFHALEPWPDARAAVGRSLRGEQALALLPAGG